MQTRTTNSASLVLPAPVARYFASEAAGPEAVAQCFTENARDFDEHHEHRGHAAIAAWKAASNAKYTYSAEPLRSSTEGDVHTVTAKVTGTFPGSPIDLRYRFTVDGDLIARLEIAP